MAQVQLPSEFYEIAMHHLPPEEPVGPQGGRPATAHKTILRVIWYVLVTGIRWRDVPAELGCSGETARSRLRQWEEQGIWDRLHLDLLRLLRRDGQLEHEMAIIDRTRPAFSPPPKARDLPPFSVPHVMRVTLG